MSIGSRLSGGGAGLQRLDRWKDQTIPAPDVDCARLIPLDRIEAAERKTLMEFVEGATQ